MIKVYGFRVFCDGWGEVTYRGKYGVPRLLNKYGVPLRLFLNTYGCSGPSIMIDWGMKGRVRAAFIKMYMSTQFTRLLKVLSVDDHRCVNLYTDAYTAHLDNNPALIRRFVYAVKHRRTIGAFMLGEMVRFILEHPALMGLMFNKSKHNTSGV